jgi:hypothetical protein
LKYGSFSLNRAQRKETPMRTNIHSVVTGNVFGFGQDRVVVSSNDASYAHAAQHLKSWHASKCGLGTWRETKRTAVACMAGAALVARQLCLVITGPLGLLAKPPALVTG